MWPALDAKRDPLVVGTLGALVLVRIALPLAVLAGRDRSILPGLPQYTYHPRPGDAHGYHAAARELIATPLRLGIALPAVVLLLCALGFVVVRWRSDPARRPLLALAAVWCLGTIVTLVVLRMRYSGAVTIGWPLLWSLPLAPFRAVGLLDLDVAFGVGIALSLAANAATVVGSYLLGLWSTSRRAVGLLAASLFAFQPLLLLALGKTKEVSTWQVDLGLHLYSEPLSTALVVWGCALIVRPGLSPLVATVAGALLGFAVTVRLSNAVIAACVVAVLLLRRSRAEAVWVAAAGLAFLPVVVAYWPLGYSRLPADQFPDDPFGLEYAGPAWTDSVTWGVTALVALVPLAAIGAFLVPRWNAVLLVSWVLGTALFYTFYSFTPLHPRFLFVALPAAFVLWAAAVTALADRLLRLLHEPTVDSRR